MATGWRASCGVNEVVDVRERGAAGRKIRTSMAIPQFPSHISAFRGRLCAGAKCLPLSCVSHN